MPISVNKFRRKLEISRKMREDPRTSFSRNALIPTLTETNAGLKSITNPAEHQHALNIVSQMTALGSRVMGAMAENASDKTIQNTIKKAEEIKKLLLSEAPDGSKRPFFVYLREATHKNTNSEFSTKFTDYLDQLDYWLEWGIDVKKNLQKYDELGGSWGAWKEEQEKEDEKWFQEHPEDREYLNAADPVAAEPKAENPKVDEPKVVNQKVEEIKVEEPEAAKEKVSEPVPEIKEELVAPGKTWAGYAEAHLQDIPDEEPYEQKLKRLSKVMVGRLEEEMNRHKPGSAKPFSVKQARKYAADLQKNKVFQTMFKDEGKVDDYLDRDGFNLAETAVGMFRPFQSMTGEERARMLLKMKDMAMAMDVPANRSSAWKKLMASMDDIDLKKFDFKSDDPKVNGEAKLQEIFDSGMGYMKGRKSLRNTTEQQKRFNQALDVVAELGSANDYARAAAQTVVDRINEVRTKHDRHYYGIRLEDYGMKALTEKHLVYPSPAYSTYEPMRLPKLMPGKTDAAHAFSMNDIRDLPKALTVNGKNTVDNLVLYDSVLKVSTELFQREQNHLNEMPEEDIGIRTDYPMKHENTFKNAVVTTLALSSLPAYLVNHKETQTRVPAVDGVKLEALRKQLENDPAVLELMEQMKDPLDRQKLMGSDVDWNDPDVNTNIEFGKFATRLRNKYDEISTQMRYDKAMGISSETPAEEKENEFNQSNLIME